MTKTPKRSAVDEAAYAKAAKSGMAFTSRKEAAANFETKYKATYVTSFNVEPVVRPTYVPRTYLVGGVTYPVVFSPVYHGYGYYVGSSWVAYDLWHDTVMLSALMANQGYYYDTHYNYSYNDGTGTVSGGFGSAVLIIILFFMAIIFLCVLFGGLDW